MARRVREIRELGEWIRSIRGTVEGATVRAFVKATQAAERGAKALCQTNFTGTSERPKQGFLLNAIFSGYETGGTGANRTLIEGFVGVLARKGRLGTRPYGRTQEFGATIVPRRAKNLWIPLIGPKATGLRGEFRDVSPTDFITRLKAQQGGGGRIHFAGKAKAGRVRVKKSVEGRFVILPGRGGKGPLAAVTMSIGRGKTIKKQLIALFALRQEVTLSARPFVGPAVDEERARLSDRISAEIKADGLD